MVNQRKSPVYLAIVSGLISVVSSPIFAQDENDLKVDKKSIEKITVVGSRIKKQTFESVSPITVVDGKTLTEIGYSNLEEALAELPQLTIGTNLGNSSDGSTSSNLRGAGVLRTLTLINGRRTVSSNVYGTSVDMSTIPVSMVKQVEILTGGASAVYGSDAVAGVINIVLKKDYQGFDFSGRTSLPEHGGAESNQFSFTMGGLFDDGRGSVNASVSFSKSNPLQQKDRSFVSGEGYISSVSNPESKTSTDGIPDRLIIRNLHTGSYPATGGIRTWNWDSSQYDHYYIDELSGELVENTNTFYGQYTSGGPGFAFGEYAYQMRGAQNVFNSMVNMNYDFDDISFSSSFTFAKTKSTWLGQMAYTPNPITVYRENPTLPQSVRDFMDERNWSEIISDSSLSRWDIVYRTHEDFGRQGNETNRTLFTGSAALEGNFMDWDWEVSAQYGQSNLAQVRSRLYKDRHDFAFDVVTAEDGSPVCRAVLEGNEKAEGCLPLNILGVNDNQAALDWVKARPQDNAANIQSIISGFVSGEIFDLPGGPVNLVLGGEYRRETIEMNPDAAQLSGNILLAGVTPAIAATSLDVNELFTEINIPLLEEIEVTGSYRVSDYSTVGKVEAWGVGADYDPTDELKIRASVSASVRAPSVYDLFNPGTVGFAFITDPCNKPEEGDNPDIRKANCALAVGEGWEDSLSTASRAVRSGGNPELKPEEADTISAGFVYSPKSIENLNISVDWWKIDIENEISSVSSSKLLSTCYDTAGLSGSACNAITRRADGAITEIRGGSINLGYSTLEGVDYEFEYEISADSIALDLSGSFGLSLIVNQWLDRSEVSDPADYDGTYFNYKGNFSYPDFIANLSLSYTQQDWGVTLRTNLRDKSVANANFDHDNANYDEAYPEGNGEVGFIKRFDLYSYWNVNENTQVTFGIRNVTDEIPPRKTSLFGGNYGISDAIGRSFNLGFSTKL